MVDENKLGIEFTADASGVQAGSETAIGSLEGIHEAINALNSSMGEMAGLMRQSLAQAATAAAEASQEMHHLEEATEGETSRLREMALSVHEGVESFNRFKIGLAEIAEVYMAAFAVERVAEWANEMGEAAEKVVHLSETFGMTTGQIQQLQGIAAGTGLSVDTLTRAFGIMDKTLASGQAGTAASNAFKELGISIDDGRSQMEKMMVVADKFRNMDDGPKKVALAMEIFGRSGKDLIPILDLGSKGIEELNKKTEEYGVKNDDAVQKGFALAESINTFHIAMMGAGNTMTEAFAPILKEIVDGINNLVLWFQKSYESGGLVAITFMQIRVVVEEVIIVIKFLASVFDELWSAVSEIMTEIGEVLADLFGVKMPTEIQNGEFWINMLKDAFTILKDIVIIVVEIVKGHIQVLVGFLQGLAVVAHDAFTLQWDKIESDWTAAMDRVAKKVEDTANRIQAAGNEIGAATMAMLSGQALPDTDTGSPIPKAGGNFDPHLGATHKGKEKDRTSKWDEQLAAQKEAYEEQQDAAGTFHEFSKQQEADYWGEILQRDDLTAKERGEIAKKFYDLRREVRQQDFENEIAGLKKQEDEARGHGQRQIAIAEDIASRIGQKYGEESKQYEAAQDNVVKIRQQVARQLEALDAEISKSSQAMAALDLQTQEDALNHLVSMGAVTKERQIQQEEQFLDQKHQLEMDALQTQISKTPENDPVKLQQLRDQMLQVEHSYQNERTRLVQQAEEQRTAIERGAIGQTSQLWAHDIARMATLQEGLGTAVRDVYLGMVSVVSGALEKIIEQWLTTHITAMIIKRTTSTAEAAGEITANAGVAASAAFASIAAIPIVGPELAPAAAAAAMAGALSFLPMASAARGWGEVPYDGAVTELHKEEMVLPSELATPLRQMLTGTSVGAVGPAGYLTSSSGSPGETGGTSGRGDHYHTHVHAIDTQTGAEFLMRNRHHVARAGARAYRENNR